MRPGVAFRSDGPAVGALPGAAERGEDAISTAPPSMRSGAFEVGIKRDDDWIHGSCLKVHGVLNWRSGHGFVLDAVSDSPDDASVVMPMLLPFCTSAWNC